MPYSITSRALVAALLMGFGAPSVGLAQRAAEAFLGQPFGVGRVEIDEPQPGQPDAIEAAGLLVTDKQSRVFYPAATAAQVGRTVRNLVERIQRPRLRALGELAAGVPTGRPAVYFLFRGQEPLQVTIQTRQPVAVSITPVADPVGHQKLLDRWWRTYADAHRGGLLARRPDYPPMVETYLQSMLAQRLGLSLPERRGRKSWEDVFGHELGLSVASEPIRVSMLQERMLGRTDLGQEARLALPAPIQSPELSIPDPPADVKLEPMAMRVPEECLYLHFGSYPNYLWYSDTMRRWGGDLRNLIAERGIRHDFNDRSQQMMILRPTELSRLFGPTVIADAAIIGSDLYQPDGAALGMLFQARNGLVLATSMATQRAAALKANKDAREEKLEIAGRRVSFIHTPGNTIRSFYAADGDFHFICTSRTLMRRFLETASGQGSLGRSKEFRYARSVRPPDAADTVFAYLSAAFFRNMVRPEYRVEIGRRLQAAADIDAVQMAQLVAAAEGQPDDTVEQLRSGGFLPREFGPRPDGSRAVIGKDEVTDSLRGARGTFLPVPDVEVSTVTPAEAEEYARFAEYYATQFGPVEPMVIVLRRVPLEGGRRERVVIDANLGPLNRRRYDFFAPRIGAPDTLRLAPVPGDVLFVEAILKNQRLLVGLRDFGTPPETPEGGLSGLLNLLPTGGRLRDLFYGYIGTVGDAGLLGVLDRSIVTPPDSAGFAHSLGPLWRRDVPPFRVYSLHREILAQVTPQLRMEQAERPAQVRVRLVDLSQAGVAPVAQQSAYRRALSGTQGNLRLLHAMIQQFHVPAADALSAAELVLGADLVCPLSGRYEYRKLADGSGYWTSTALDKPPPAAGAISFPPLNWFRGLSADALLTESRLWVHAEVDMELSAGAVKSER